MGLLSTKIRKKLRQYLAGGAYFCHRQCFLCRCFLAKEAWGLCEGCKQDLPWLYRVPTCKYCNEYLSGNYQKQGLVCCRCIEEKPLYHKVYALFAYAYPIMQQLAYFKYHKQREVGRWMAKLLYQKMIKVNPLPQALLPVPLHNKKLHSRGFNQADDLCYFFKLEIPVETEWVVKTQFTQSQTQKNKEERRKQLIDSFKILNIRHYQHVAIVDDVMTTGATVSALTQLLITQGVKYVDIWVVARA